MHLEETVYIHLKDPKIKINQEANYSKKIHLKYFCKINIQCLKLKKNLLKEILLEFILIFHKNFIEEFFNFKNLAEANDKYL